MKRGWQGETGKAGDLHEPDDAGNPLALHTQDKETKKLIDLFLSLPPIEPESRVAIGACWKQSEASTGKEDRRREPRSNGRSSLEPEGERHGHE